VSSYWSASENNRKAMFYRLSAAGRGQLARETSRWRRMIRAIGLVMGEEATPEEALDELAQISFRRRQADAELQENRCLSGRGNGREYWRAE